MWTETHFYCFPSQEAMGVIDTSKYDAALDFVGTIEGVEGYHVNARWLGEEPEGWAEFRVYPESPRQDFA